MKFFKKEKIIFYILPVLSFIFFSCKESGDYLISSDSIRLRIVSGNNQSALVDQTLSNPIVVKLGLSSGIGLPDKIINVSVIDGGGEVNSSADTTNSDGLISIVWKMGYKPGSQKLKVTSQGLGEIEVNATALAKPGKIEIISGNEQAAYSGDTLLSPIIVSVKDSLNNPIKGRLVTGNILTGSGKLIPSEQTTNDSGYANFHWIVGSETEQQKVSFLAGTSDSAVAVSSVAKAPADQEITIFNNAKIEYPNLQTISKSFTLPDDEYYQIEAELDLISPCKSCSDPDCDPWDRIGFITVDARTPGGGVIRLELLRFITPFGNSNTYVQDVSQFASLLKGNVKFNAYISTFIGHWNITFKLRFKKATLNNRYIMASPVIFDDAMFSTEEVQALDIDLPENNDVILTYFTTGHNNKGRNCDEFCKKVNEIYVDNKLVLSFEPWQANCEDFAEVNRCEGAQTLSFDRAGWCPGDIVRPHIINVGKLGAGKHIFKIHVVNIEENGGYWRTSLSVVAKK